MTRPKFITIDGRRYLWKDILELRRKQLAEVQKAAQPALFPLKVDARPPAQRTVTGRHREPTLFPC